MTTPVTSLPMQNLLERMQGLAGETAGKNTPVDLQPSGGFGAALKESLQRINSLQNVSTATSQAFQSGDAGVELHEVMIAGQKASIAFEMGVQVRNRLLNAYKDIMNMQV